MLLEVSLQKQLGDFSFATEFTVSGQRIGVFGPSGSGKSTLSHLLTGFLAVDQGRIILNDHCLFDSHRRINLNPEKRRVAVVFQHAHLFPHLNVRRNLLYGWLRARAKRRKFSLEEVATALGIKPLLSRSVAQLSGGEQQRVALGRALLASPDLLILDEPLSALDQELKEQIIPYLDRSLRHFAMPYLYISHSLREMRLMTDQVLQFSEGQLRTLTDADSLALQRMTDSPHGYFNHLQLCEPVKVGSLYRYRWGHNELLVKAVGDLSPGLFALSSKDILLFKRHPQALSARNLLKARISELLPQPSTVGVRLDCNGSELVAQVVPEAARELELRVGGRVYLAIKASGFGRLD